MIHEDEPDLVLHDGGHLFESERCLYCYVNVYDISVHGAPEVCPLPREPLEYTTQSASWGAQARTEAVA